MPAEPQPPARVVSMEEVPKPPPGRPRRASILVRTIGDLQASEPGEVSPVDDDPAASAGVRAVAGPAIVRIIGGANGDDGDAITAIGGIRIVGSHDDEEDLALAGPSIVRVIGGANGDDGDAITAIGGIRIIGSHDDDEVR